MELSSLYCICLLLVVCATSAFRTKCRFVKLQFLAVKYGSTKLPQPHLQLKLSNSSPNLSVSSESKVLNYAALLTVPLLWGTYSPLIKKLYLFPSPPPTLIFNLLSFVVSLSTLVTIQSNTDENMSNYTTPALKPGIELGLWLFIGSTLQLIGIQGTSASHAAVLVQLTTLLVPILDSYFRKTVLSGQLIFSCVLALIGVMKVTVEGNPFDNINFDMFSAQSYSGDLLVCLSAFFYALHVVRLGSIAPSTSPVTLSLYKSLTELTLTYTTWAQTFGQKQIPPTQSNLIYSMQPIWAAIFSYFFIGEQMTTNAILVNTSCKKYLSLNENILNAYSDYFQGFNFTSMSSIRPHHILLTGFPKS
eukprot:gene632-1224_t